MLGLIVMSLAIYIWFAPGVIYAIRSGLFDAMRTGQYNPKLLNATTLLLFAGAILPVIYLSVCWTFTMLLIVDMEMNFWNAIKVSHRVVHMHWWSIFALLAVSVILSMLGCFACCIGVFFTMPLLYASMVFCYEDIFGVKHTDQR